MMFTDSSLSTVDDREIFSYIPGHKWEMIMWRSRSDLGKNLLWRHQELVSSTLILTSYSHSSQKKLCLHEVGLSSKPLSWKLFHRRPFSQMLHSLHKQKFNSYKISFVVYHHEELPFSARARTPYLSLCVCVCGNFLVKLSYFLKQALLIGVICRNFV